MILDSVTINYRAEFSKFHMLSERHKKLYKFLST
ncbi:MAG: hypothetical protein ACJ72J_01570 [Nitrososphaeraceae archaeon]